MLNKRYALLGWLTWRVGKRMAARKARAAVPNVDEGRRHNKGLIVSALAAVGAAVFFWRRRGDAGDTSDTSPTDQ